MRQRSKEELLNKIRIHQALKKDINRCNREQIAGNAAFWRASVEWVYVLWQQDRLNVTTLKKILEYAVNNYAELTEDRRKEIRQKMKGCNWVLKNTAKRKKCKNAIDQSWNDLEYFNTEVSVDFSLLVCEWLIDKKKYRPEQVDRACEEMLYIDAFPIEKIYEMRKLIYKHKNIWISLNEEDTEEWLDGDDIEMVVI